MKISYERDMSHNYMVLEAEDGGETQEWQIQMLTENQIGGLLRCAVKKVNCRNRYCYDITSRQSMAQLYETHAMHMREIRKILGCLYRTLRETEKYLLDAERIVLDPQCIYMDIETGEAWFCYLPEYRADLVEAFRKLTSWFLCHLDQKDALSVFQSYQLYRKAREQREGIQDLLRFAMAFQEEKGGVSLNEGSARADERIHPLPGQQETENRPEPEKTQDGAEREREDLRETTYEDTVEKHAAVVPEQRPISRSEPENRRGALLFGRLRKEKSGTWLVPAVVILAVTAATAAGAGMGILTVTQAGEITFLAAGLAAYGVSLQKKKRKEESEQGNQAYQREQKAEHRRQKREKKADFRKKIPGNRQEEQKEKPMKPLREQESIPREPEKRKPGLGETAEWEKAMPEPPKRARMPQKIPCAGTEPIGTTTLLWEEAKTSEPRLALISTNSGNRPNVALMKDSYLIGKLKSRADIWIDDPAVSRIHARIQREGENYYLQDLNATNGTFLNGRRLGVQERVRIQAGDEIAFAENGYYVGKY